MKVDYDIESILKMIQHIDKRKIPSDVVDILNIKYYSMSKNEYIRIGDMDIMHLLRIFNKSIDYKEQMNLNKGVIHDELWRTIRKDG